MKQLLETIVKGIVNEPDGVSVEERESVDFPGLTILEITVADADKGILIGRKGRTINAIRDLMTISAIRNDKKIKVLVNDDRDMRTDRNNVTKVEEAEKPQDHDVIEPGNELPDDESRASDEILSDEF